MVETTPNAALRTGAPERATATGFRVPPIMLGMGVACILISTYLVNFWIYHAVAVYSANNPDLIAAGPVTVSRAITDPMIADYFAYWISVAALSVTMSIALAMMVVWQQAAPILRDTRRLSFLLSLLVVLQFVSATGMMTLSHFRLGEYTDHHMTGSYMMFFGYPFVIVVMMLIASMVLREGAGRLPAGLLRAYRARMVLGWIIVALSLSYLALFIIKDIDLGALDPLIYLTYTRTEPVKLSVITVFLMTYLVDIAYAFRGR